MDLSAADHLFAGAAAVGAGLVNAIAGGGTLLSFPTLVALGVPAVQANVTNTVALCSGYFGGTHAQRAELVGQRERLMLLGSAAAVGGLAGSMLLVATSENLFEILAPVLVLVACALLGLQNQIKRRLPTRSTSGAGAPRARSAAPVFLAGVYGGYFGAGLGIVLLAVLGLLVDDTLVRNNALKQALSLVTNVVAAAFFVTSGKVVWSLALVMAPASLLGGAIGGRLVGRINPWVLRSVVIGVGLVLAVTMLVDLA